LLQVEKGPFKTGPFQLGCGTDSSFCAKHTHWLLHMHFDPCSGYCLIVRCIDQNPDSYPVRLQNPCVIHSRTEFRFVLAESYGTYLV